MKHAKHSYQDLDIAEYVLGLHAGDEAAAIQACLARDNAAAACALKWEAYLLSIADELERVTPSPELQARIRATLGHEEPVDNPIVPEGAAQASRAPARRRTRRLRRGRLAAVGAAVIGLLLLGVVALAMWHSTPPQATEQAVELAPPAHPASKAR